MKEQDKRFLLFLYDNYYPEGGLDDLRGSYDNLDELYNDLKKEYSRLYGRYFKKFKDEEYDNGSIYDRIEGMEIELDMNRIKEVSE